MDAVELVEFLEACVGEFFCFIHCVAVAVSKSFSSKFMPPTYFIELVMALSPSLGKTLTSYRMALEYEISSWREFEKALNSQDREAFEQLMDASRNHCMVLGYGFGPVVFEAMTMSTLLVPTEETGQTRRKNGTPLLTRNFKLTRRLTSYPHH